MRFWLVSPFVRRFPVATFNFRSRDFSLVRPAKAKRSGPAFRDTEPNDPIARAEEDVWRDSSFDLRRGLEISEQPLDSLPGELRDAFGKV
ncbi:hypothetical protein [Methylibium sp.]|uniref:hypothetical protein n=1 Tax=Methylibium sp. TaxID=2067992 RepID=UPI00286B01A9|nr:hypothetical protein [Methylibium sp.]